MADVDYSTYPFIICNRHNFDYLPLIPAAFELCGGYSFLSGSDVVALSSTDTSVDPVTYLRKNCWLSGQLLAHVPGGIALTEEAVAEDTDIGEEEEDGVGRSAPEEEEYDEEERDSWTIIQGDAPTPISPVGGATVYADAVQFVYSWVNLPKYAEFEIWEARTILQIFDSVGTILFTGYHTINGTDKVYSISDVNALTDATNILNPGTPFTFAEGTEYRWNMHFTLAIIFDPVEELYGAMNRISVTSTFFTDIDVPEIPLTVPVALEVTGEDITDTSFIASAYVYQKDPFATPLDLVVDITTMPHGWDDIPSIGETVYDKYPLDSGARTIEITGCEPETAYYVRFYTTDGRSFSDPSNIVIVTTKAAPVEPPPDVPEAETTYYITSTGFTEVGDLMFSPSGYAVYPRAADPLLGDLLCYSYLCMANGDPSAAIAAVQVQFMLHKLILENKAPNLICTGLDGVTPNAL